MSYLNNLNNLNETQIKFFAWLCGVRILPFLGASGNLCFWEKDDQMKHLYSVLYSLDIAYTTVSKDFDENKVRSRRANEIAANASRAASKVSYTANGIAISYYADAIARVVAIANACVNNDYAAEDAIHIANCYGVDLVKILISDIECIIKKKYEILNNDISLYGSIWNDFQTMLHKLGCEYWGKLYANIFLNNFNIDKEALERRLNIPVEISEQGAKAVASYLEELEKGSEQLNEARIIILGEKGAGKTSLAVKLHDINAELPKIDESTKGVDVSILNLPDNSFGGAVNVHIWDFAGHVVTHSTHKFFMSERCVYIIVYDGRTERRNFLEYWLDHVVNYGGNSPVFVLVNKRDGHLPDIDENGLIDKYPQIQAFYYLSLQDNIDDIQDFRKIIEKYVKGHAAWNREIPKLWFDMKEKLTMLFSTDEVDYITTEKFKDLAQSLNVTTVKDIENMRTALHLLGICLYYEQIKELQTLVLNPNWITNGIYLIINYLKENKDYKIKLSDLKIVFKKELGKYPINKHYFLFELLELYDLAYPYKTEEDGEVLVIPALLTEKQPELNMENEFPVSDSLCMRYRAESALPPDTISRFIVSHHQEIVKKDYKQIVWRKGVKLGDTSNNIALVREVDREIRLYVKGNTAKEFLSVLRNTLNKIFKTYKSKYPSLEYKIAVAQNNEIIYADDGTILGYMINNIPYFEHKTGGNIIMENIAEKYNITDSAVAIGNQNNIANKSQGTIVGSKVINKTEFNFHDSIMGLIGNLNELQRILLKERHLEEAVEILDYNDILEEVKDCETSQDVENKGFKDKILDTLKKLGTWLDVSDKKSIANKIIKAGGEISEIVEKIIQIVPPLIACFG